MSERNYRPIYTGMPDPAFPLPVFNKMFERVVNKEFYDLILHKIPHDSYKILI